MVLISAASSKQIANEMAFVKALEMVMNNVKQGDERLGGKAQPCKPSCGALKLPKLLAKWRLIRAGAHRFSGVLLLLAA